LSRLIRLSILWVGFLPNGRPALLSPAGSPEARSSRDHLALGAPLACGARDAERCAARVSSGATGVPLPAPGPPRLSVSGSRRRDADPHAGSTESGQGLTDDLEAAHTRALQGRIIEKGRPAHPGRRLLERGDFVRVRHPGVSVCRSAAPPASPLAPARPPSCTEPQGGQGAGLDPSPPTGYRP
jgi:hypothetical protein